MFQGMAAPSYLLIPIIIGGVVLVFGLIFALWKSFGGDNKDE